MDVTASSPSPTATTSPPPAPPSLSLSPHPPPLTIPVVKRIPPRRWLGPLGRAHWHSLLLTISPTANIAFAPLESSPPPSPPDYVSSHQPPSPSSQIDPRSLTVTSSSTLMDTLVPAGARHATHSEHLVYAQTNLVVLTTVSTSSGETRPRRQFHVCRTHTQECAAELVAYANAVSFRAVNYPSELFAAPFLYAWGVNHPLPLHIAVDACAAAGFPLREKRLSHLLRKALPRFDSLSHVSPKEFVQVMIQATVSEFEQVLPFLKSCSAHSDLHHLAAHLNIPTSHLQRVLSELKLSTTDINPDTVLYLLFRPANSVIDDEKASVPHDMTRPLSDYLISSSHNTYLTGDQLQSASSADMYRVALEKGCRCVEIDAWNGEAGAAPVVTHGHTMTSDIPLKHVLDVIAQHAFTHGNDAPVIISLENHLDFDRQRMAADLFQKVFKDRLFTPDAFDTSAALPSPDSLRGKVIIKSKTLRSIVRGSALEDGVHSGNDSFDSEDTEDDPSVSDMKLSDKGLHKKNPSTSTAPKSIKIATELDAQIPISNGDRKAVQLRWKQGDSVGVKTFISSSCISLDEKRMEEAYWKCPRDVIREYNQHALTRVYPKGSRISSSNYTPTMAHSLGCQLVALNWQKHDAALAVNEARFLSNRGCGYVLANSVQPATPRTLKIRIMCAFLLSFTNQEGAGIKPHEIDSPYCTAKLYDEPSKEDDLSSERFETQRAKNALAPVWNEQPWTIEVQNVNLAVIILKVYDRDRTSADDLIGYCAVPTALIREGLRSFPLKSKKGDSFNLPGTDLSPSVLCDVRWL